MSRTISSSKSTSSSKSISCNIISRLLITENDFFPSFSCCFNSLSLFNVWSFSICKTIFALTSESVSTIFVVDLFVFSVSTVSFVILFTAIGSVVFDSNFSLKSGSLTSVSFVVLSCILSLLLK